MLASITKNMMGIVLVWASSPNVVYKLTNPLVFTLSSVKSIICLSYECMTSSGNSNFLNVFQYKSTELPWSTNIFLTAKFLISIFMTMWSSCFWSMNVIGGILCLDDLVTTLTDCTSLGYLFLGLKSKILLLWTLQIWCWLPLSTGFWFFAPFHLYCWCFPGSIILVVVPATISFVIESS